MMMWCIKKSVELFEQSSAYPQLKNVSKMIFLLSPRWDMLVGWIEGTSLKF